MFKEQQAKQESEDDKKYTNLEYLHDIYHKHREIRPRSLWVSRLGRDHRRRKSTGVEGKGP